MRIQKFLLAAALLSLGIVSCQKDEQVITHFTAGIEQPSKTHLDADGMTLKWDADDEVMVYNAGDAASGVVFTAANLRNGDAVADLVSTDGIAAGSQYYAIHPVGVAASASSVTLPTVQLSADGSLADFPMYAVSGSTVFHFENLCGALRIHLQQSDAVISRIEVVAGTNINGTYTIDASGEGPMLTNCADGHATTALVLTTAQSIAGEGHDFYIYLPAGTYQGMRLTFYQPDGTCCTKTGNVDVVRSKYSPIVIDGGLDFSEPDLLPGYYSVSPIKLVRFAKGNLVATTNGGTPGSANTTWAFHGEQFGMLWGNNNVYGRCELFGWSTGNTYYGLSISANPTDYSGDFIDWGTVFGQDSPWHTLTSGEWNYLMGTRAASTVNGTSNARYAEIRLSDNGTDYIAGLLLFPDKFVWPAAAGNAPAVINAYVTPAPSNNYWTEGNPYPWAAVPAYTFSQFNALEGAGCVFLPAAGYRYYTDLYNMNMDGNYWSSSSYDGSESYFLDFDVSYNETNHFGRQHSFAVRLTQTVD